MYCDGKVRKLSKIKLSLFETIMLFSLFQGPEKTHICLGCTRYSNELQSTFMNNKPSISYEFNLTLLLINILIRKQLINNITLMNQRDLML